MFDKQCHGMVHLFAEQTEWWQHSIQLTPIQIISSVPRYAIPQKTSCMQAGGICRLKMSNKPYNFQYFTQCSITMCWWCLLQQLNHVGHDEIPWWWVQWARANTMSQATTPRVYRFSWIKRVKRISIVLSISFTFATVRIVCEWLGVFPNGLPLTMPGNMCVLFRHTAAHIRKMNNAISIHVFIMCAFALQFPFSLSLFLSLYRELVCYIWLFAFWIFQQLKQNTKYQNRWAWLFYERIMRRMLCV